MTGFGIAQIGQISPNRLRRSGRWRVTTADRLLGTFLVCALLPTGALAVLWFANAPITDLATPYPYVFILALLGAIVIFDLRIRSHLARIEQVQTNVRTVTAEYSVPNAPSPTGDEVDELGTSFEAMADRMYEQLRTLTAIHEIDRAVLSTLDPSKIVETVLTRVRDIAPCDAVTMAIAPATGHSGGWTVRGATFTGREESVTVEPTDREVEELWSQGDPLLVDTRLRRNSYLSLDIMVNAGIQHFLVYPFFRDGAAIGLMALGFRSAPEPSDHDRTRIRRLVDQVTVALSNARLIEEVSDLSWGAVTALARTIDACSPWTAGHSERVTRLALAIGQELGLSKKKLDRLHRGGLLHDIGKIGITRKILNKRSRLTPRELKVMQNHTTLGADILSPIPQYADVVPIVLHHHERLDGTGYPHQLAGKDIPFLARVLAVADVYDALRTERPYRPALSERAVMREIRKMTGGHLDSTVVEAFMAVKTPSLSMKQADMLDLTFDAEAIGAWID
jgi:putative nucleotidyltransferase with HDIG domain